MTFTTFCRFLSQAVIHSRQPVALNWARNSFGLVLTVFLRKICILGIAEYFLIVLFQISEIKKDEIRFKKYFFFARYVFDCRGGGEGSSNRNASRDESVEARDKSVEAGDESIEAGEKTPQWCYNSQQLTSNGEMSWTTYTVYNFADDLHLPELGILLESIDYHAAARKASFLGSMCEDSLMAAIHFERRFDALMKYVINSQEHPIGKVKDFIYRVEFKIRGSCHYLVTAYFFWVKIYLRISVVTLLMF